MGNLILNDFSMQLKLTIPQIRVCRVIYIIMVALQPTPHQSLRDSFFLRKRAPLCRYATFPLSGESPQGEALDLRIF